MAGQETAAHLRTKYRARLVDDLPLCAAHVGEENFRRQRAGEPCDEIDDRPHRGRENDDLATADRGGDVDEARVNRSLALGTLEHRSAIATHDAAEETVLFERKTE